MALDSERDGNLLTKQAKVRRVDQFKGQVFLRLLTAHSKSEYRDFFRTELHGSLLWRLAVIPITVTENKDRLEVFVFLSLQFECAVNISASLDKFRIIRP